MLVFTKRCNLESVCLQKLCVRTLSDATAPSTDYWNQQTRVDFSTDILAFGRILVKINERMY